MQDILKWLPCQWNTWDWKYICLIYIFYLGLFYLGSFYVKYHMVSIKDYIHMIFDNIGIICRNLFIYIINTLYYTKWKELFSCVLFTLTSFTSYVIPFHTLASSSWARPNRIFSTKVAVFTSQISYQYNQVLDWINITIVNYLK